jgi:hypothetical protein
MEPLEGIAAADAHLGRRFPLPTAPLPLARWVDVRTDGPGAAEVAWNLDDTRDGTPGRLALRAGREPAADRGLGVALQVGGFAVVVAPLAEAAPSLRPVHELRWSRDGLHLRLTAQGPWELDALLELARSVA